jgi:hypothetical protein
VSKSFMICSRSKGEKFILSADEVNPVFHPL